MPNETKTADDAGCFYCQGVKPFFQKAWSDASKDHFRSARVEFLKGVRSVIDERLACLTRNETKGTHVTVE